VCERCDGEEESERLRLEELHDGRYERLDRTKRYQDEHGITMGNTNVFDVPLDQCILYYISSVTVTSRLPQVLDMRLCCGYQLPYMAKGLT
jgi:hypothetical protein